MLDQIMNLVKDQVTKTVGGMKEIPQDQKTAVVNATSSSLMSGLKKFATPDKLVALLGGGALGGGAASGIVSNVVSQLTSKVGLSPAVAQTLAAKVVPAVTKMLGKKVGDANEPGFNIQSLIGGLTGGKAADVVSKAAGSVMGKANNNVIGKVANEISGVADRASGVANKAANAVSKAADNASGQHHSGVMDILGGIFGKKH